MVSGAGSKSEIRGRLHKVQANLYFSGGHLRSILVAYRNAIGEGSVFPGCLGGCFSPIDGCPVHRSACSVQV